jgi:predicted RNase H-like HicB family nuclease
MARFTVLLYPEEGGYSAIVPLLYVASQGDTVEEALAMAKEAAELQVQWLVDHGEPVLEEESPPIVAGVDISVPVPVEDGVKAQAG